MLSRMALKDGLFRHEFIRLGGGLFGEVFAKPHSRRCIKVGSTADNWEAYVIWAQKNGFAGSFAPKVYAFHRYPNYTVCSMERLTETVAQYDMRLNHGHRPFENLLDNARGEVARGSYRHAGETPACDTLEKLYPGITCFMKQAYHAGFNGDWHQGNWMLHMGRLVLIDPQSDTRETGGRRWWPQANSIFTQPKREIAHAKVPGPRDVNTGGVPRRPLDSAIGRVVAEQRRIEAVMARQLAGDDHGAQPELAVPCGAGGQGRAADSL